MLVTLEKATEMINNGMLLGIAADDSLLSKLPKGHWIGGTTPYFISEEGGIKTTELLSVSVIDVAEEFKIGVYGRYNVFQTIEDCYDNGLNALIFPYGSQVEANYAKGAPDIEELFMHPTIGWVSGYDFIKGGQARVYNGETGESFTDKGVALLIKLPEGKSAVINVVNIFEDDKTDPVITFPENTFSVGKCYVNGQEVNFADYIERKNISLQLPLVSDYNGVLINTGVKSINRGRVELFSPVFRGQEYRFAVPVGDYAAAFKKKIDKAGATSAILSCNCVLNYIYGNLEGKKTPPFSGPVTFGEIAYQMVNQTLVYAYIA